MELLLQQQKRIFGTSSGKLPTFLNNFSAKNNRRRKRYDVTGKMHVAFSLHFVVLHRMRYSTNFGAKFDASRIKIASTESNSFYTLKKPMIP